VNITNDSDVLRFFRFQLHPMLVQLYMEAQLEIPLKSFDYKIEGPRLVAAFRAQGFSTKFPIVSDNVREKK
jgi:hypothetical protein